MKLISLLLFLVATALFISCQNEESISIDPYADIKEAFDQYDGTAFGLPDQFTIQWSDMTERNDMIIFPAMPLANVHASDSLGIFDGEVKYELIARKADGELQVHIAKLRPYNYDFGFTGEKHLYNLSGELDSELHVEQGVVTRETSARGLDESTLSTSRGRTEGCNTYSVRVDHYTDWYDPIFNSGGELTGWEFDWSQFTGSTYEYRTVCSDDSSPTLNDPDATQCRCSGGGPMLIREETDKYICPDGSYRDDPNPEGCLSEEDLWEQRNVSTTESFDNNPCTKGVLDALDEHNIGYELLTSFLGEAPTAEVEIDLVPSIDNPNSNSTISGQTLPPDENGLIRIEISQEYLNQGRSNLEVSRTILHELIHAELWGQATNGQSTSDFWSQYQDFVEPIIGSRQHNLMAQYYIDRLASMMQEFDFNANSEDYGIEMYKAGAWVGLEVTDLWTSGLDDDEKSDIKDDQDILYNFREQCD